MGERCRYTAELIEVEGYAMIGMIKNAKIVPCKGNRVYIEAMLSNGEKICTRCMDAKTIELGKRVIDLYTTLNIKGMMIGITTKPMQ